MLLAGIVCSSCEEEREVLIEDLSKLDAEACDCGYEFVLVWVEEAETIYARA